MNINGLFDGLFHGLTRAMTRDPLADASAAIASPSGLHQPMV
jgi:hypothetical protein